jgi:hypothetical protein
MPPVSTPLVESEPALVSWVMTEPLRLTKLFAWKLGVLGVEQRGVEREGHRRCS